jgi:hypothetical protein
MRNLSSICALSAIMLLAGNNAVRAQGSAFLYEGALTDGGGPAQGEYDIRFRLYDAAEAGNQSGSDVALAPVAVADGRFTVSLDFGAGAFDGGPRWLELAVRSNGVVTAHTVLSPRQRILPLPYAIHAGTASGVASNGVTAVSIQNATLTADKFATGQVVKSLNSLRDDVELRAGANISLTTSNNALVIAAFGDGGGGDDWHVTGNLGTTAGVNFLGTTDNQALEFKVDNLRALRLQPDDPFVCDIVSQTTVLANSPSLVAGYSGNSISPGASGSLIAGGGAAEYPCLNGPGVPMPNIVTTSFAVILGGVGNANHGTLSTIGGGVRNTITSGGNYSFIGHGTDNFIDGTDASSILGGHGNRIEFDADGGVIGGGAFNSLGTKADFSLVGGGTFNAIHANATNAVIAGGSTNLIQLRANFSTIGGGRDNLVGTNSILATIAGGGLNHIDADAGLATIGGGSGNHIGINADYAVIAGGRFHWVRASAAGATISGGSSNDIGTNATYTTISGGIGNIIQSGLTSATIGGGNNNEIGTNSTHATIAGGSFNAIQPNAAAATIGGGGNNAIQTNTSYGTVSGGFNNVITTNADFASVPGGRNARAVNYGQQAHASGRFAANGDAQSSMYVLRRTTTTTNLTELFLDGSTLRMKVPTDGVWTFDILVVASSGNDYASYQIRGIIGNFAGLVGILGAPSKTILYESDASWDANVDEDIPDSALAIKVRGAAGTPIRWVASVRTAEVIY